MQLKIIFFSNGIEINAVVSSHLLKTKWLQLFCIQSCNYIIAPEVTTVGAEVVEDLQICRDKLCCTTASWAPKAACLKGL